mmetsp:Transcript_117991/g.229412  ORF Transcript_117991/g.229412 Transcript_117991/m.229412 type:complete len:81 (+) Transcript_117991:48-290(+)
MPQAHGLERHSGQEAASRCQCLQIAWRWRFNAYVHNYPMPSMSACLLKFTVEDCTAIVLYGECLCASQAQTEFYSSKRFL